MSRQIACALYLACLALPALAQTAEPQSEPAAAAAPAPAVVQEAAPTTVVVEGRRPGPGVWKVSKDGHVMWVFGLYSPLPRKMEWDASRVERLITHSQEVLLPPGVSIEAGFFRSLTMLPSMIGLQKNPDNAQLKDVLPADVYARWQVLKGKYIGDDESVERYRPIFAAQQLMQAGLKKNGLSQGGEVRKQIETIAKLNEVKTVSPMLKIELEDPRGTVKEFKKSPIEDVACFTKTLDGLEGDLDAMRVRANAWANGNIAEIKRLDFAEREQACGDAVFNSQMAKNSPALHNLRERMRAVWIEAVEKALAENASTFAVLQMKDIVDPKGLLADLQARGYTVESRK
jgi:hypothetical protein